VAKALKEAHCRFIFNADETELNRKGGAPGLVACPEGEQPCVVVDNRTGSHVSLFLFISADGEVAKPYVVLHGKPHAYCHCEDQIPQIKLVETENGYMDKPTFKRIMMEYFIPHVQSKRHALDLECARLVKVINEKKDCEYEKKLLFHYSTINRRAVLIVDGHKSRYDPETLKCLREADIDLVVLPAHTSHFLQPLDLKLNGLIKDKFGQEITEALPAVLSDTVSLKPPPKKQRADGSNSSEPIMVKAEYDRVHVLEAIRDAITATLIPRVIINAFSTSHLYPFREDPPYSKEKEDKLLNEIKSSAMLVYLDPITAPDGKTTGVVNKSINITGVINSVENLPVMTELLTQELEPQPFEGHCKCSYMVSEGPRTAFIEATNDDDDIGDTLMIVPGENGMPNRLVGQSDAVCYVNVDKNDLL